MFNIFIWSFSEFIMKIEPHVHVPEDFLAHLISRLREPYRLRLEPPTKSLENISACGNLLGAVQEVHCFFMYCFYGCFLSHKIILCLYSLIWYKKYMYVRCIVLYVVLKHYCILWFVFFSYLCTRTCTCTEWHVSWEVGEAKWGGVPNPSPSSIWNPGVLNSDLSSLFLFLLVNYYHLFFSFVILH